MRSAIDFPTNQLYQATFLAGLIDPGCAEAASQRTTQEETLFDRIIIRHSC